MRVGLNMKYKSRGTKDTRLVYFLVARSIINLMTSGEFNHHRYHTNWYHEIYAYEPNELAKTGMREFSFDLNPP